MDGLSPVQEPELLAMAAGSETRLCFFLTLGETAEGELASADSKPNRGSH